MADQDPNQVLVVGAGPAGLLLAAELHRRGVPCLLIDARSDPLHWDRATVVHPRSLEIFESLGIADRFLAVGTPQRGARIHSNGEVLGAFDLTSSGSSYPYSLGVSEEVTESILTDHLHALGGEVSRGSRLVALTPRADGVRAEIERDGERVEIDAAWVVGCDGLHSPTRDAVDIAFEGHDFSASWAVFDTTLDGWDDVYDLTFVYLEAIPVILTALPGRRWRAYLRPSAPDSDLVADATATLRSYYPAVSCVDVENPTRFHCATKVATHFRSGRVLLAGDAAHLCSPAQGHGMNTGLHDAANLAWKLALVHQGLAAETLLDSYEAERRPIAALVGQEGDEFEEALSGADHREDRDESLRKMLAEPTTRQHEVVAEAELDVEYRRSPIVDGDADEHLAPGQRLPDTIAVEPPGGTRTTARLHQLTHRTGHTLVLLGGPAADADALGNLVDALEQRSAELPIFEATVALGPDTDRTHRTDRTDRIGLLPPDSADRLGVRDITLLAVRPDGYVGLRADHDHVVALCRYHELIHPRGH